MNIKINNLQIKLKVKKLSRIEQFIGLMFRTKETQNLLFNFNIRELFAIHSFFVFFPFIALWLDADNNSLGYDVVLPFTPLIKARKNAKSLIEIPFNERNKKIIDLLVDKRKI